MLIGSNGGHIDWLVVTLESNIKDHDGTIIETNSQKGWIMWMEVDTHNTTLGSVSVLWPSWILNSVTANET
jgi:hypothetical protein